MWNDVMKRIADRTISEPELRSAIEELGEISEPPTFWVDLAADAAYPATHRGIFICELFNRHLRRRMPLAALAALLGAPAWITTDTVTHVAHLKGEIPVEWNIGETVLAIRLFPDASDAAPILYLRLSAPLEVKEFVRMVHDSGSAGDDGSLAGIDVLEAACTRRG